MLLEREINCIISQSKLNVFELRKCMKTIAICYGNWWELPKRNITQIKYWKRNQINTNSGQLSKVLSIEIRRLNFKKKIIWMMADTLQIWKWFVTNLMTFYWCGTILIQKNTCAKLLPGSIHQKENDFFFISWTCYRSWNKKTYHALEAFSFSIWLYIKLYIKDVFNVYIYSFDTYFNLSLQEGVFPNELKSRMWYH